jgi:hypothetical protein
MKDAPAIESRRLGFTPGSIEQYLRKGRFMPQLPPKARRGRCRC